MTQANHINRRRALTVVAAVPAAAGQSAVGLCSDLKGSDAAARVEHHAHELGKAMRDLYGLGVEVLRLDPTDGLAACVLVAANGGGTTRPAANSRWLYVGDSIQY
jgi:hypothetical protein